MISEVFVSGVFSSLIQTLNGKESNPNIPGYAFPSLLESVIYWHTSYLEKFSIVPLNQISNLSKELNQLMNHPNFIWLKSTAKDSSLYLWDLIQNTYGEYSFTFLPRLFEIAHSLPTSSAGIEQSFSLMKLVRNTLRSNLREDTTQSPLLINNNNNN